MQLPGQDVENSFAIDRDGGVYVVTNKALYRFEDADHVTSRWTWYQDGTEKWLEEIRLVRKR